MFAIIFFVVFVLFANESKALKTDSICCEELELLLKNKTVAYQTVCLGLKSRWLNNCCSDIVNEIEKLRHAYKTLCIAVSVPKPQAPRSCLDHLDNGLKTNGYYNIYDASSNLITVYCDMTSEPGKAWTLVMSFALSNKDMTEFQMRAFHSDSPVNESLPNWKRYRMSLSTMNDLRAQSTLWRATCSFPTHGVDYVDYVRGKFASLDVMKFNGTNVCKRVEFVNIRGHHCSDCDLPWWQGRPNYTYLLHTDSSYATCGFNARQGAGEDNFGYYFTINPNFRCTADASATTNWWFGGNIV